VLSNTELAELLAREAEKQSGILARAYRRAARSAFLWPEEVSDLIKQKAKIPSDRVINFLPLAELKRWVAKVRRRR